MSSQVSGGQQIPQESAQEPRRRRQSTRGEDVGSSRPHAPGKPHQSCPAAVFSPVFDGVGLGGVLCHLSEQPSAVCEEGDKVTHRFTPACGWTPVKPVSRVMRTQSSIHGLNPRTRSGKRRTAVGSHAAVRELV